MPDNFRAVILHSNSAEGATLSGGSYSVSLPRANMQDPDIGVVAQTSNDALASTQVLWELGTVLRKGGVTLGPINVTPGSLARLTLADDSGFTTIKYQSGWEAFPGTRVEMLSLPWGHPNWWNGVLSDSILPELPMYYVKVLDLDVELQGHRYGKLEFDDQSNEQGYHRYGYLGVWDAFRPSINYDEDNSTGIEELKDTSESLGGKRSHYERGLRRTWRGAFKHLSQHELFGAYFRMMVKSRSTQPIFMVPDPSDTEFLQQRAFLATFKQIAPIQQLLVERGSTQIEAEEVL